MLLSPVKEPPLVKLWREIKNFVMAALFPNEAKLQPVDPSDIQIYSLNALERRNYASYPVFSLHEKDVALIEDFLKATGQLGIQCAQISLPGPTEQEIGFLVKWEDIEKLVDYFYDRASEDIIDPVWAQFDAWISTPTVTQIPNGMDIPASCFPNNKRCLQKKVETGIAGGCKKSSLILLNVLTGERIRVKLNFVKKTYKICGDISGWKHVAYLPDL